MINRSKNSIRPALAGGEQARAVREERLGQAETPAYTGALVSARPVTFAAKITGFYNRAGGAYTDWLTDGPIAFVKCHSWNIGNQVEGETDLWIACRNGGFFGLMSADDWTFGASIGDIIVYIQSRLPVQVPGDASGTYFNGIFDPMETSQVMNETTVAEGEPHGFWASITGAVEGGYGFVRVLHEEVTGCASEVNGVEGIPVGTVVWIEQSAGSVAGARRWSFEYAGSATPGDTVSSETAWGITPDAGSSADYSRADHTHGSPPEPEVPAPGDTVSDETTWGIAPAAGASAAFSRADHTHGSPPEPEVPDPGVTVSDETTWDIAPYAGELPAFSRADHTHGSPPDPAGDTVSDETGWDIAPAAGASTAFSRADHTHGSPPEPAGTPGDTVSDETSWGITPAAGSSDEFSRADHTHGSPEWPSCNTTTVSATYVSDVCFTTQCVTMRTLCIDVTCGLVTGWSDA
jgi:hypothetical protein